MINNLPKMICFDMDGMEKEIWLDCDGTWINLYGVENWLEMLMAEDPTPYVIAKPLVNLSWLARTIHELQNIGFKVGIISWLSKNGSEDYNIKVEEAKRNYLKAHLPSVAFDEIHILPYGTPKNQYGKGILFDDEEKNREQWNGLAFNEENLIKNLREILHFFGQN